MRQIGILRTADGSSVGVSILTIAPTFGEGISDLNTLTDWLSAHVDQLPSGQCTPS